MNARVARADLPDLRQFLDSLPVRPCPAKLPEEYCKICKRLNNDVYNYCQKHELPSYPLARPIEEPLEEKKEIEEEAEAEEPRPQHRTPILERPKYEEGETPLEFAPSLKSIEEAKRSLPRFIPVQRGPRAFRAIEEPGSEEGLEEFATFDMEAPSIFRSRDSIAAGGEDMMFTLVADEDAIEVKPLEISSEDTITSETIYESSEGVVEVVEVYEGETPKIEAEPPVFEFIDEGEAGFEEVETIEAEVVGEEATSEEPSLEESMEEAEREIKALADEISGMTDTLEGPSPGEGMPGKKVSFKPVAGPLPHGAALPMAKPVRRRKKFRVMVKRKKAKKPEEMPEEKPELPLKEEIEEPTEEAIEEKPEKEITEEVAEPEPVEERIQPSQIQFTEKQMEEESIEEEIIKEPEVQEEKAEPELIEETLISEEIKFDVGMEAGESKEIDEAMPEPIEEAQPPEEIKFAIKMDEEIPMEGEKVEEMGGKEQKKRVKKLRMKKKKKMKLKKLKLKKPKITKEEKEVIDDLESLGSEEHRDEGESQAPEDEMNESEETHEE